MCECVYVTVLNAFLMSSTIVNALLMSSTIVIVRSAGFFAIMLFMLCSGCF